MPITLVDRLHEKVVVGVYYTMTITRDDPMTENEFRHNLNRVRNHVRELTGPHRGIDLMVAKVMGICAVNATMGSDGVVWYNGLGKTLRDYTGSVDAALSLVPKSETPDSRQHHMLRVAMASLTDDFSLHSAFWPVEQDYAGCLARNVVLAIIDDLLKRKS